MLIVNKYDGMNFSYEVLKRKFRCIVKVLMISFIVFTTNAALSQVKFSLNKNSGVQNFELKVNHNSLEINGDTTGFYIEPDTSYFFWRGLSGADVYLQS